MDFLLSPAAMAFMWSSLVVVNLTSDEPKVNPRPQLRLATKSATL
jgi:hypothetical protein